MLFLFRANEQGTTGDPRNVLSTEAAANRRYLESPFLCLCQSGGTVASLSRSVLTIQSRPQLSSSLLAHNPSDPIESVFEAASMPAHIISPALRGMTVTGSSLTNSHASIPPCCPLNVGLGFVPQKTTENVDTRTVFSGTGEGSQCCSGGSSPPPPALSPASSSPTNLMHNLFNHTSSPSPPVIVAEIVGQSSASSRANSEKNLSHPVLAREAACKPSVMPSPSTVEERTSQRPCSAPRLASLSPCSSSSSVSSVKHVGNGLPILEKISIVMGSPQKSLPENQTRFSLGNANTIPERNLDSPIAFRSPNISIPVSLAPSECQVQCHRLEQVHTDAMKVTMKEEITLPQRGKCANRGTRKRGLRNITRRRRRTKQRPGDSDSDFAFGRTTGGLSRGISYKPSVQQRLRDIQQSLESSSNQTVWLCAFCGEDNNFLSLGGLYGPYYVTASEKAQIIPECVAQLSISPRTPGSHSPGKNSRSGKKGKPAGSGVITSTLTRSAAAQGRSTVANMGALRLVIKAPNNQTVTEKVSSLRPRISADGEVWVHLECALWAPGTYIVGDGTIGGLGEALQLSLDTVSNDSFPSSLIVNEILVFKSCHSIGFPEVLDDGSQ
ncbi:hypothetical protein D915_009962 [Fasciola hepatica]|uniref:Uncharacterized protein n=1 Tax=Fasciola hepatica TaxID=6192 RepID=A0A4E0QW10_FASHE|nr:hypothetical protein D915_009962 [Fasciola hepatica]